MKTVPKSICEFSYYRALGVNHSVMWFVFPALICDTRLHSKQKNKLKELSTQTGQQSITAKCCQQSLVTLYYMNWPRINYGCPLLENLSKTKSISINGISMLSGKTIGEFENWKNSYEQAISGNSRIELLFCGDPEQM